jgi:hypothetical protein
MDYASAELPEFSPGKKGAERFLEHCARQPAQERQNRLPEPQERGRDHNEQEVLDHMRREQ